MDNAFEEWANAVLELQVNPFTSGFKRTVYIDVYDLAGNVNDDKNHGPIASYKLNRCWITKYTALPELDAGSSGVGIQSATLRHEGWERVL
jgi:phage tail-like protein